MSYTLLDAINKTRRYLKDATENVWSNADIIDFINDGIRLVKQQVPEYFTTLVTVSGNTDVIYIDDNYVMLPAMYSAAKCFDQDEQFYRATNLMNEFESRRVDMDTKIRESDAYALLTLTNDYVIDEYYTDVDDEDEIAPLDP